MSEGRLISDQIHGLKIVQSLLKDSQPLMHRSRSNKTPSIDLMYITSFFYNLDFYTTYYRGLPEKKFC